MLKCASSSARWRKSGPTGADGRRRREAVLVVTLLRPHGSGDKGRRMVPRRKTHPVRLMAFVTASARKPGAATAREAGPMSRRIEGSAVGVGCATPRADLGPATQELPASGKVSKDKHDPLAQSKSAPQAAPRESSSPHTPDNHSAATHNNDNQRPLLIILMPHRRFKVGSFGFSNVRSIFQFHRTWRQSQSDPASIGANPPGSHFGENVWRCHLRRRPKSPGRGVEPSHCRGGPPAPRPPRAPQAAPSFHGPAPSLSCDATRWTRGASTTPESPRTDAHAEDRVRIALTSPRWRRGRRRSRRRSSRWAGALARPRASVASSRPPLQRPSTSETATVERKYPKIKDG